MKEVKMCPVCGLEMKRLSLQLWECRCGHVERGKVAKEKERGGDKKESKARFWEKKQRKGAALSHGKGRVYRKEYPSEVR